MLTQLIDNGFFLVRCRKKTVIHSIKIVLIFEKEYFLECCGPTRSSGICFWDDNERPSFMMFDFVMRMTFDDFSIWWKRKQLDLNCIEDIWKYIVKHREKFKEDVYHYDKQYLKINLFLMGI